MSFDLSSITTDNAKRGTCTVIHSAGGVGKTTFAANAVKDSGGIMILGEDGLSPLGIKDIPRVQVDKWSRLGDDTKGTTLQEVLKSLMVEKHNFKLVAIDTIDALVPALETYVVNKHYAGDIDKANAYKAKYQEMMLEFNHILQSFKVLQGKGIDILVIAHSVVVNHRDPSTEDYQRWQINLPGGAKTSLADMLYNYADNVFYGAYDVLVSSDKKAKGGARVLHTEHAPAYDAKNRYGLPSKIAFDYSAFQKLLNETK